jgi:L-iditol 2-dehydrogenase
VSDEISFEEAAFAEPLSCVLHSFKRANVSFGDTVFILGGGPMGLLHLMLAKLNGCKVVVSEPDDKRRKLAENIGANMVVNPLDKHACMEIKDLIPDEVFITVGNKEAVKLGLKVAKKLSTVILYGSFHPSTTIEISSEIHYSENTFTGSKSQTAEDFLQTAELLSRRAVDVRPLISKVIPLKAIERGFEIKPEGEIQRVVIRL